MGNFFSQLANYELISTWADTLDWLLDDRRFSTADGWTTGYVGAFTKNIKKLPHFSDKNYHYGSAKNINFPNVTKSKNKPKKPTFYLAKHECEGRDIVRHIRNGIAHGNAQIYHVGKDFYIEILDYRSDKQQTAYIAIPLDYITEIHRLYEIKLKAIKDNNTKRRKSK